MPVHGAADVGDDALAGAHHQMEARVGRDRQDHRDGERPGEREVEHARIAAAEAGIHHVLEPLPEREPRDRRDYERRERARDPHLVRAQERGDFRERAEVAGGGAVGGRR